MGQVSTEQVIAIIDASKPETQLPNYWWLLFIAVIPVILTPFIATWYQNRKK